MIEWASICWAAGSLVQCLCVFTVVLCVIGRQPLSTSARLVDAAGWKAQHRTGNRMEHNSQLGRAAQLSRVWNSYRTHDDIGMQSPMAHFITNQWKLSLFGSPPARRIYFDNIYISPSHNFLLNLVRNGAECRPTASSTASKWGQISRPRSSPKTCH